MAWKDIGTMDLNQSKIQSYLRCAKQFEFSYIKGIKMPPNLKMLVGSATHKGIELNYAQKVKTKKDLKVDIMMDAARDEFRKLIKTDDIKTTKIERGRSTDEVAIFTKTYHEEAAPRFQPLVPPELYFEFPMDGVKGKLYGTIDLVAAYNGFSRYKTVVSDSKTTRRSYDNKRADVDIQLTAYAYAWYKKTGKLPEKVMFDTVVLKGMNAKSEIHISERKKHDIEIFEDTVKMVSKGIATGIFPATSNAQTCSWCGYASICLGKNKNWSV